MVNLYHINNAIFKKTVTKLFTILKNAFLPNLNPISYLKTLIIILYVEVTKNHNVKKEPCFGILYRILTCTLTVS